MGDSSIGLELLLHCAKQDIRNKEDILLLLVHHTLLKAGFKCAGNGENWSDETLSEILPNGWNVAKEYTLRYKRDEDKFILISNRTDDVIVFNFTSPQKMKVTNMMFNVGESVKSVEGCISTMVPNYENMLLSIAEQLVKPYATAKKVDTNTQTTEQPSKANIITPMPEPSSSRFLRNDPDFVDINAVGRRDLDPLAAMGGGMLFDPLRENRNRLLGDLGGIPRLPRGAVPPRARFDPFGPLGNIISGRPPPDYDMFS